jgi:predicted nucleic acid-binding protein
MVVVDTNILAYLLIQGDRTDEAQALFRKDPDWHSEPFILIEFSNILATCLRTKALTKKQAINLLSDAERTLRRTLSTVPQLDALELAHSYRISAYDARFLAAAHGRKTKLITEDTRLRTAAPDLTLSLAHALKTME